MEYCCYICDEAFLSSLSSHDRVQKRLRGPAVDELFSTLLSTIPEMKSSQTSLYCISIFMEKYSDSLSSLVPSTLIFTAKTRHAINTSLNCPNLLPISLVRKKFHSDSLFIRSDASFNTSMRECFLDFCNLNPFNSNPDTSS